MQLVWNNIIISLQNTAIEKDTNNYYEIAILLNVIFQEMNKTRWNLLLAVQRTANASVLSLYNQKVFYIIAG